MKNKFIIPQIFFLILNFLIFLNLCSAQTITSQLVNDYDSAYPSSNPNEFFEPDNFSEPQSEIDLKYALTLALLYNRDLALYGRDYRIKESLLAQSKLLPNPELSVEIEDFSGSREFHGDRQMQLTTQLSQVIQLGGKRSALIKVTDANKTIALCDYELKRLEIFSRVSKAFVDVVYAQNNLENAKELVSIAKETHQIIKSKADAGRISTVEVSKSLVSSGLAEIEFEKTKRQLISARKNIASIWGNNNPRFTSAKGLLEMPRSIPDFNLICSYIDNSPEQIKCEQIISMQKASLDLEKANAIPDLTLMGGYRYINETEDNTLVAGISVPLPLFNRNQGNILATHHELTKAVEEKEASRLKIYHDLALSYEVLSTFYDEAENLQKNVLPEAQKAFDMVKEGYQLGKFGYLDLLDSQRTLFSIKQRIIETLANYHKQLIDIETVIGVSLEDSDIK